MFQNLRSREFVTLLGAAILALPGLVHSQSDSPDAETLEASEALIDTLDMEKVMGESLEASLDLQMQQFTKMGMKPEGVAELRTEMLAFMKEVMNWEELRGEFVRLYAESFSARELGELTAFYQTSTGKKAVQVMPQLMQKGMVLGQEKVQARSAELQQRILPIIQKHMAPQ